MKDDVFDNYRTAGTLAARILREGAQGIRVGASYLGLVESIEARVREDGAALAFPLNLSLNEDAAHDTASYGDERVFSRGDVAKLDLGVQVDGYIADTATTVDLGNNALLLEASSEALESAIRAIKPGVHAGALGGAIQAEIEGRGYRPVANLTGHGLDRYVLHRSPTIPNIGINGGVVLEEGMVFAIEPFATTGSGHVGEKKRMEIYSQISARPVRVPAAVPFSIRSGTATACRSHAAGSATGNWTSPSLHWSGPATCTPIPSFPMLQGPLFRNTSIPSS